MLLLYRSDKMTVAIPEGIYIPLCFYFIVMAVEELGYVMKFTFHYASTLSQIAILDEQEKSHLHSTMLLLYLRAAAAAPKAACIYIPLCFYFIRHGYFRKSCGGFIYIPLCFYFICYGCLHSLPDPYLHSTMLLLYPVSFFSPYFLHFKPIFCPPSFLVIFLLKKHPL